MALLMFPALTILSGVDAPIQRVAQLSRAPTLVGVLFVLAALGTLPHLLCLLFAPGTLCWQWPRQLAAGATSLAALLWCYLANLAEPLDYDAITAIYWTEAFLCAGVGFLYAFSLNQQQVRSNDQPHAG